MAPRQAYRQPQAGSQGFARTKKVFGNTVALLTTDVALNAQTAVLRVPKGFVLTALLGSFPSLAASALVLALGDAGLAGRFFTAQAVGVGGGAMPALASTGLLYEFTDDTDIILTATTGAVTPTAGTAVILMEGYIK